MQAGLVQKVGLINIKNGPDTKGIAHADGRLYTEVGPLQRAGIVPKMGHILQVDLTVSITVSHGN